MEKSEKMKYILTDDFIHFFTRPKDNALSFVQLGHQATHSNYACGPNIRDHYVLHFIHSGKGVFQYKNKKYYLSAGDAFLIEATQISYYQSDSEDPWEYYWLGFDGYMAESYCADMGFSSSAPVRKIQAESDIFQEFDRVLALKQGPGCLLAYYGLLHYVLYFMCQTTKVLQNSEILFTYVDHHKITSAEYVQRVISLIRSSYMDRILIQDLADKLSLNRSYLSKIFKEETGQSLKSYLTDYRLNIAAARLMDSDRSITQIASETGFQDPLYFSRVFHQKYGVSPAAYRKSAQ